MMESRDEVVVVVVVTDAIVDSEGRDGVGVETKTAGGCRTPWSSGKKLMVVANSLLLEAFVGDGNVREDEEVEAAAGCGGHGRLLGATGGTSWTGSGMPVPYGSSCTFCPGFCDIAAGQTGGLNGIPNGNWGCC